MACTLFRCQIRCSTNITKREEGLLDCYLPAEHHGGLAELPVEGPDQPNADEVVTVLGLNNAVFQPSSNIIMNL